MRPSIDFRPAHGRAARLERGREPGICGPGFVRSRGRPNEIVELSLKTRCLADVDGPE